MAKMYDLKTPSLSMLYENDVKALGALKYSMLKWGRINDDIGFILTGPKENNNQENGKSNSQS